jgi:5'(3')-deoxyribonucleotidase
VDKELVWMDLDGVLANIDKPILDIYNAEHGTSFVEEDIKHWSFQDIFPTRASFYAFFGAHASQIYADAVPYGPYPGETMGSKEFLAAVEALMAKHTSTHFMILFSSFVNPTDAALKMSFLREWYSAKHAKQLLCGHSKAQLFQRGNIVIDDGPKNLVVAREVGAVPIGLKRPWNTPKSNPAWDGPRYTFEEALRRLEEALG